MPQFGRPKSANAENEILGASEILTRIARQTDRIENMLIWLNAGVKAVRAFPD